MPPALPTREMTADERSVVEVNMGLAYHIAIRFDRCSIDGDDRKQIAILGLIRAAQTFDPARRVTFATYATTVIRTHLVDAKRSDRIVRVPNYAQGRRARKRGSRCLACAAASVYRFSEIEAGGGRPMDVEDHRGGDETTGDMDGRIEAAIGSLDPELRRVVRARLARRTLESIGRKIGCSTEWVRQLECRAHREMARHIRDAIEGGG